MGVEPTVVVLLVDIVSVESSVVLLVEEVSSEVVSAFVEDVL